MKTITRGAVGALLTGYIFASTLIAQGTISTYAGTQWIFQGGGKSALMAPLANVSTVTADRNGNIIITDPGNAVVLRLETNGTLTVIAGNGLTGFSGDGGPAINAALNDPEASVYDSQGNLYIADTGNNRVRMVTPSGTIQTIAGAATPGFSGDGGPAVNAQLNLPLTLAIDASGALYVNDRGNSRIRRIATTGTISTFAGTGQAAYSGDGGPAQSAALAAVEGITIDASGNLYLADFGSNRIRRVSPSGIISTVAGDGQGRFQGDGGPALSASLFNPGGVAIDNSNNIYISDTNNFRIRKINPQGVISTYAGSGSAGFSGDGGPALSATFAALFGLLTDTSGDLYIADRDNYRIRKINSGGVISTIAGNGLFRYSPNGARATSAFFYQPFGVSLDATGNLYISDTFNNRVEMIGPAGTISTVAGSGKAEYSGDGGAAAAASISGPTSTTPDKSGNLYIADTDNSSIRKVSPGGVISTVAGNGQAGFSGDGGKATSAMLNGPQQVAFDASGNMYISDFDNNRIRRVTTDGNIATFAGNGQAAFSGDGSSATSASLNGPAGLVFDGAGNLYVADVENARVRRITPAGVISTFAGGGTLAGTSGDNQPATQTKLGSPLGLAIDSKGNLYVSDVLTNLVKVISPSGIIATVAGNGKAGYTGDGGPATSASLDYPYGLAVDSAGGLLIADALNNRIRAVLAGSSVTYQASPASLQFTATAGGSPAAAQVLTLATLVPGLAFTTSTTASATWLSLTPATGSLPTALQITVDATGLAVGAYNSSITITVPQAATPAITIPVTLTVQAGTSQPILGSNTPSISFLSLPAGSSQTAQVQVTNSGTGTLNFTAAASVQSGSGWLSVGSTSGTATPAAPASISVIANPAALGAGTYQGAVTLTSGTSSLVIPVTLSISATGNLITISQSALSFTTVAQGGMPLPQTFGVLNTGTGSMAWSASSTTLSGGANWLQVSPASGTVQRPYLDVSTVTVSMNPAGLAAGVYYGRVLISAAAANSPQVLTVALTVLPGGSNPGPDVQPTGLIFTGNAGSIPAFQTVTVGNPTGQTTSFLSGTIGAGYTFLPTNADVQPSVPQTISVFPDFTSLAAGAVQRGTITLQFSDGTPRTVSILSVVAPSAAAISSAAIGADSFLPFATSCGSSNLQVQFQSLRANYTAAVGQATTIQVHVVDQCGNPAAPSSSTIPTVTAFFSSGDSQVALTSVGNGVWSGTWRPVHTGSSVTVNVTALWIEGTSPKAGQASVAGVVSTANGPILTSAGIVHAATSVAGVPLSPGGLITIYGANLASSTALAAGFPLPVQLGGAQVLLGNLPMPIIYASSGQLNVQVPYEIPTNTQFQISVQRDMALSVPQALAMAVAQPGIFTLNEQGTGQGAIFKSDGVTLAQPGTPASIGETIVIYCTGLGPVTPSVPTGTAAPADLTVNPATVSIGGQPAAVVYSGLTPGSAGLYQINAVVPAGIATGDAVPILLTVAQQSSPAVTLAVH